MMYYLFNYQDLFSSYFPNVIIRVVWSSWCWEINFHRMLWENAYRKRTQSVGVGCRPFF